MSLVAPPAPPALAGVTLGAVDIPERGQGLELSPAFGLAIDFQVPKGCVVRNTFLEWAEEDGYSHETGTLLCAHEPSSPSSKRRPRSCPPQPDRARRLIWQSTTDEEASTTDEELSSSTTACATPDRGREPEGEEAGILDGTAAAETPPPPVLPGVVERRSNAAPVAEKLECDDDGSFTYRRVKHSNLWLQDTQTWQGRSPQTAGGCGAGASAFESHAYQRTPKSAPAKGSHSRSSMVLRGLPFDATEADVVAFINQHGAADALAPLEPVSLAANPQGKPSGFAEVHLNSHANFLEVQGKLHNQRLGERYIEVLPPNGRGKASPWKSPAHRSNRWNDGNRRDTWRQM
jgi:hypothetical protein